MLGKNVGKYQILDRIGRGSMGTVYHAADETLHRDVAIKILNADLNDPAAGRRFRAEAIAIARLNHPGIAKIYELFEHEGQWLMAMEFVRGETLESLVTRSGPLSADRAAELVSQALAAIAHAHGMGVVHRDLKPANLMVADGRLKVMDFGIARVAGTEHLTSAGLLMGTPAYMAPEQVLGGDIDARTDIFAMGCVLYFLATAKLPFKGETVMEIVQSRVKDHATPVSTVRHELPAWFGHVVERALARNAAERFQTADEFREALERGRAGLPLNLHRPAPIPAHLVATVPPGSMPVAVPGGPMPSAGTGSVVRAQTGHADSGAQPVRTAAASGAVETRAAPKSRAPLWIGAAAAVVVIVAAALWFRPAATPGESVTPSPLPASESPITGAAPGAAAGSIPTPPATTSAPTPTSMATPAPTSGATPTPGAILPPGATPTPGATPAPGTAAAIAAGRGRRGADTLVSFTTVKLLRITGRRAEELDAVLRLGGGLIAVEPKRADAASAAMSLPYKELLAATYVRERDPRWAANLAGPPANLDLPGGGLFRRASRNWLVLQGQTRYMVLVLADADAGQVLAAVTDRTRVKIGGAGGAK